MSPRFDRLPEGPISINDAVTWALNFCNFGRLNFCDHVCERILAVDPNHLNAALIRGISAHKRGDNPRAAALIGEVARRAPDLPDAHHHLGVALLHDGRLEEAAQAFSRALDLRPDFAEAMAGLGEILRRQGRGEEAFDLLKRAVGLKFNHSPAYISHSLMCFDRSLPPGAGPAPRRPRRDGAGRLTMASLANYGRFAQTVNEYVAVRLYAETYGMSFETPDWIGHRFFQLDDPEMDPGVLPAFEEWLSVRDEFARGFDAVVDDPYRDRDLFLGGSPVNPMRRVHRDRIQSWLTPRPCWSGWLDPAEEAVRAHGRTLVVLHIRQTDWWNQDYTPLSLYLEWLDGVWPTLDDPVLFVSTDEPRVIGEFARFRPLTSAVFPIRWEGLEYLQDFHLLTRADVVAVSTGSFARTAVALNRGARLLLQPNAGNTALEPFDPWL